MELKRIRGDRWKERGGDDGVGESVEWRAELKVQFAVIDSARSFTRTPPRRSRFERSGRTRCGATGRAEERRVGCVSVGRADAVPAKPRFSRRLVFRNALVNNKSRREGCIASCLSVSVRRAGGLGRGELQRVLPCVVREREPKSGKRARSGDPGCEAPRPHNNAGCETKERHYTTYKIIIRSMLKERQMQAARPGGTSRSREQLRRVRRFTITAGT